MDRRSVLGAGGVVLSTVTAGWLFDETDSSLRAYYYRWFTPDKDAPADECELIHDLEPSRVKESYDGEPAETYRYENLSREAQRVFDEALAGGSYRTTDQRLRSEEFRYGGLQSIYHVIYRDETYVLATYVNEGCHDIEDAGVDE